MGRFTMDDIAARAGVSRGAVSLALRRSPKISEKTTAHILEVAKEMGYRPNVIASRLAAADFSTFGVLVSDLHNPIMADIVDGIVLEASEARIETYLASGFNSADRERAMVESFLSHRVKGIVLLGSLLGESEIRELSRQVPTVAVGRRIGGVDCVSVDDEAGGRIAAEHLMGHSHAKMAHIDGGDGAGASLRREAFLRAAANSGCDEVLLFRGDYTQESGYRCARELFALGQYPTGIFAANDLMALGVLGAAREAGLTAGLDFELIGFDNIAIAAYDYVSLTTISYSRQEMGASARELILGRSIAPDSPFKMVELRPELIVRNSTRKALALAPDAAGE
ncbi:LacI family DNA-binding transcriptional regulator [Rhizobium sp. AN80A]|uniref:LacI family DNA-binding transcriptional regulator n=1 Tax=Rhizobium sp. AN80A TaxID=3040673 RepID=UPI0024B3AE1A|nr:LacI family DNA-binding transcriptional regulator [Rhizobium sp. AN80A]